MEPDFTRILFQIERIHCDGAIDDISIRGWDYFGAVAFNASGRLAGLASNPGRLRALKAEFPIYVISSPGVACAFGIAFRNTARLWLFALEKMEK